MILYFKIIKFYLKFIIFGDETEMNKTEIKILVEEFREKIKKVIEPE